MNVSVPDRKTDNDRSLVYRQLEPTFKRCLVSLSRLGWIYIGRNGYGFTWKIRRQQRTEGTAVVIDKLSIEYGSGQDSLLARSLIQSLVAEGTVFCPYSKAHQDYYEPENPVVSDMEILKPKDNDQE